MVSFGAELHWVPVEVLAAYQRVRADLQTRGRVRHILNEPQPELVTLRHLSASPIAGTERWHRLDGR